MLATTACAGTAFAEPYSAHTDLEVRLGGGVVCGACTNTPGISREVKLMAQIFADRLFPIKDIREGTLEIGPYVKGALIDGGTVPQIAGGAILGYRFGQYEILVNGGLAYATERIGATAGGDRIAAINSNRFFHPGQTKFTYDLGLSFRYDVSQCFFSAGFQHNSNGDTLGLNFFHGKGGNPGYDSAFVGVGIHF